MEGIDVLLITQARTGSTRLPGKILLTIMGETLLEIHLHRLKRCQFVTKIVVATTVLEEDTAVVNLTTNLNIEVRQGSVNDVLDRYYQIAKEFQPKWVVRLTSDCPLIDPLLVDAVIAMAQVNNVDYCANIFIENFPDGQDVEVFKFTSLEKAWQEARLRSDREHVTTYIRNNSDLKGGSVFRALNFPCAYDFSNVRMTIDESKDFDLIEKIIGDLGIEQDWLTYTNHIFEKNLHIINSDIVRNEGMLNSLKND